MRVVHLLWAGGIGGIERLCVDINRYADNDNYFYFVGGGGEIADMLADISTKVYIGQFSYAHAWNEYKKLEKYCRRNLIEYVIVHHASYVLWQYAIWLKRKLKIKVYMYIHANVNDIIKIEKKSNKFKQRVFQQKFVYACNKCDGIIAISQSVKESIGRCIHKKGIEEKCTVIYNGIDLVKYEMSPEIIAENVLLYVGRLVKDKGIAILLEAMYKSRNKMKGYIIGEGPELDHLKAVSKRYRLENNVSFVGKQMNIPEWHKKAAVFVHPAICDEGFGISIVEAMASGLPCVAFRKGAIPEIIENNVNGFLVDEVSAEALSKRLEQVFDIMEHEPEKWQKIRENARKRAEDFSIQRMVTNLHRVLTENEVQ